MTTRSKRKSRHSGAEEEETRVPAAEEDGDPSEPSRLHTNRCTKTGRRGRRRRIPPAGAEEDGATFFVMEFSLS